MKLTINLEKALLKENVKSILTPSELLQVKQYETMGKIEDNSVFYRLGLDKNIVKGKSIKTVAENNLKGIEKFDKKRVFHVSQIEKICNKYLLKFLPISHFRGEIDAELPQKVLNFELIYNENVSQYNSYIIAPSKSFELEERPKDPLLFYKINDEYYYLIHKWGNDLSIFNRINAICCHYPRTIMSAIVAFIIGLFGFSFITIGLLIIYAVTVGVTSFFDWIEDDDREKAWGKFVYNNPYKD